MRKLRSWWVHGKLAKWKPCVQNLNLLSILFICPVIKNNQKMQLLMLIALFSHFISFQSFFLENDESCALPLVFCLKTNRDRQIDWWSKFTKNQKCNLLYRHVAFKILQSVSTSTRATFFSSESLKSNQLSATAQKYRKFLLSIDTKLACVSLCAKKSFKILESIIMARRGFLAEPKNIFSVSWIISDNIVIDSKMIGLKRKWDSIIIIWFKLPGIVWPPMNPILNARNKWLKFKCLCW